MMTIFYDDPTEWFETENWEFSEGESQRLESMISFFFRDALPEIDK